MPDLRRGRVREQLVLLRRRDGLPGLAEAVDGEHLHRAERAEEVPLVGVVVDREQLVDERRHLRLA
jgi:hypothetical protein